MNGILWIENLPSSTLKMHDFQFNWEERYDSETKKIHSEINWQKLQMASKHNRRRTMAKEVISIGQNVNKNALDSHAFILRLKCMNLHKMQLNKSQWHPWLQQWHKVNDGNWRWQRQCKKRFTFVHTIFWCILNCCWNVMTANENARAKRKHKKIYSQSNRSVELNFTWVAHSCTPIMQ